MESSDHKPESSDNKSPLTNPNAAPGSETEGRISFASSSSTSSFNSIDNTNDEMELMEDDDDDDENEVGGHKPKLPPMSPTSSSKNLTTPGTIGTSSDYQLQTTTDQTYEGYDSNRIPSAVFSRKPTNRMEWSVGSNESLFSIHMGNNSFSMGPDLMLPFEVNNDSNPPFGLPSTEEGVENSNASSRMNSISSSTLKDEDHSMIPKKDDKNHSFEITHVPERVSTGGNYGDSSNHIRDSSCVGTHKSNVSRESGTSSSSFAFPLLGSESGTKKMSCAATPEHQPVTAAIIDEEEVDDEKSKLKSKSKSKSGTTETAPEAAAEEAAVTNPPKDGEKKSSWLSYFSCFTNCPFNRKKSNQGTRFSKGNENVDN